MESNEEKSMQTGKTTKIYSLFAFIFSMSLLFSCTSTRDVTLDVPEGDLNVEMLKQAMEKIRSPAAAQGKQNEVSESTGKPVISQVGDTAPPKGSENYSQKDHELIEVKAEVQRVKRLQPKRKSELGTRPSKPQEKMVLGFSSKNYSPDPGIDDRLVKAVQEKSDRKFTYGLIYLDEYLTPETEKELAAAGLQILNVHGDMYTVRIPRDARILKPLGRLEYIKWMGYPLAEQKISKGLMDARSKYASELKSLPVYINLFDPEFQRQGAELLGQAGITLGKYDSDLGTYPAIVEIEKLDWLSQQDYVLFVELQELGGGHHDEGMAVMGLDYIRAGGTGTNFDGSSSILGIMDSGFMLGDAAATTHVDLNKNGCGNNYTSDTAGVWNDQHDHGTHVLGTIIGTGTGNSRYRGVATGIGYNGSHRIRAAKVFNSANRFNSSWVSNGFDYMGNLSSCDSPRPQVINFSGGTDDIGGSGTGLLSRKLDAKTWDYRQLYVISAGNRGGGASTIPSPGDAKDALTVGNVLKEGYQIIGDISNNSSRGPTGDGRMKPNLVATGTSIQSANAGTNDGYRSMTGTSMAAPHITGLAATLMQHYPDFRGRPHLLRAYLMATSILHDDDDTPRNNNAGGRNTYGLGRASAYIAHWARSGANGWSGHWFSRTITNNTWGYRDISIPAGTDRLVVVMTWDEDAASSGASKAVKYDLDLWVDRGADSTPDSKGQGGEWASQSYDDNVEYLIINNPAADTYRLKIINWDAPGSGLPAAIAAAVIKGDPTPTMNVAATSSTSTPALNTDFTVTTSVTPSAYVSSATHIEINGMTSGLTFNGVSTTREDGVNMDFTDNQFSLGDIVVGDTRNASWTFRATTAGVKSITFRVWSENGGTVSRTVSVSAH